MPNLTDVTLPKNPFRGRNKVIIKGGSDSIPPSCVDIGDLQRFFRRV